MSLTSSRRQYHLEVGKWCREQKRLPQRTDFSPFWCFSDASWKRDAICMMTFWPSRKLIHDSEFCGTIFECAVIKCPFPSEWLFPMSTPIVFNLTIILGIPKKPWAVVYYKGANDAQISISCFDRRGQQEKLQCFLRRGSLVDVQMLMTIYLEILSKHFHIPIICHFPTREIFLL